MLQWLHSVMGMNTIMPGTQPRTYSLADSSLIQLLQLGDVVRRIEDELRSSGGGGGMFAEDRAQRAEAEKRYRTPSCIEEACVYGNFAAVVLFWAKRQVDIPTHRTVYEGNDASPLMWAAFRARLDIVRFLVDYGADVNAVNMLGHSVLQWAIFGGDSRVVRFLLDAGARAECCDRQGHDAAFTAVQCDRFALLCMLTENIRTQSSSSGGGGCGSYHRKDHDGIMGSDGENNTDRLANSTTAAHDVSAGHVVKDHSATDALPTSESVSLGRFRLDPSKRDVEGHSLLHWAAYVNSPAMCAYLIEACSYDVHAVDFAGRTALIWAAREGYAETVEYLLHRGAHVEHEDRSGFTALQHARTRHHAETMHLLTRWQQQQQQPYKRSTLAPKLNSSNTTTHTFTSKYSVLSPLSHLSRSICNAAGYGNGSSCHGVRTNTERSVRDRRRCGTLRMMADHVLFRLIALYGVLWLAISFMLSHLLPPWFSVLIMGVLLALKNMLWSSLIGVPERGGGAADPESSSSSSNNSNAASQNGHRANAAALYKPDLTSLYSSTATSLMKLWRGTAVYRFRDPVPLVLVILIPLIQLYTWDGLGLTPMLWSWGGGTSSHAPSGGATTTTTAQGKNAFALSSTALSRDVFQYTESNTLSTTWQTANGETIPASHVYFAGAWLARLVPRFADPAIMIHHTLWGLLGLAWILLLWCKCTESFGFVTRRNNNNNSGNSANNIDDMPNSDAVGGVVLNRSPLWRILDRRRYAWLHPRCFCIERHMQIPLRAFYCVERDVFVHKYDGYSATLDCSIGSSNRLYYVLGMTCMTLFELMLLIWGTTQLAQGLSCDAAITTVRVLTGSDNSTSIHNVPYMARGELFIESMKSPWYVALLRGVRSRSYLADVTLFPTSYPSPTPSPAIYTAPGLTQWLGMLTNILLHGLPCRLNAYSTRLTFNFVQNKSGGVALRLLFMFYYYMWPTTSNAYGVWLLQLSFWAVLGGVYVLLWEWGAIWRGVTCVEYDNPVAPGEDGALVSIFPAQAHTALVCSSASEQEDDILAAGRMKDEESSSQNNHLLLPNAAAAAEARARKMAQSGRAGGHLGRMSIFASTRYGLCNVLAFLAMVDGRRWKGAMSVSAHNAPVKKELLMS